MAKIISNKTKKNVIRVRQKLESAPIAVKIFGKPDQVMLPGEALILGNAHLNNGKEMLALQIANQLIDRFPEIIDLHLLRIKALLALEDFLSANEFLVKLEKLASGNLGVQSSSARLKVMLGNVRGALNTLQAALAKHGNNVELMMQISECYRSMGETEKALKISESCLRQTINRGGKKAEERQKLHLAALMNIGALRQLQPDEIAELQGALQKLEVEDSTGHQLAFTLAKQAELLKNTEEEIEYLHIANAKMARSIDFSPSVEEYEGSCLKHLTKQVEMFSSAKLNWVHDVEPREDIAPIFVVGMPRSGTTLMEQMLGAHSKVGQSGESKAIRLAISKAYLKHQPLITFNDYPDYIDKIPATSLSAIARYYASYQELLTSKKMFIDKELSAFKMVGLAEALFPRAKFIHMSRAPMDIFLSCYRGGIPGIPATCNLEHMATYYIYMKKLIGHWKKIYPDKVYIMNYSDLVHSPELNINDLLSFLGLDFEGQIMEFHKRKNIVRTLSVDQVRKSIYKTAIKKWVPFSQMLKPASSVLERHGVSVDGVSVL